MPLENSGPSNNQRSKEIDDGRFFAAIGYFFILCWVPLLLKKDNEFAVFHGRQALVLFILEVAALILKTVPFLGDLFFSVSSVIFGILSLVGFLKALMGVYWELPLFSDIAKRIHF